MVSERHFDYDPPPLRAPRLFSQIGDVGGLDVESAFSPAARERLSKTEQTRLAKDLVIYLAVEGGMTHEMVGRGMGLSQPEISRRYRRMACRNERV